MRAREKPIGDRMGSRGLRPMSLPHHRPRPFRLWPRTQSSRCVETSPGGMPSLPEARLSISRWQPLARTFVLNRSALWGARRIGSCRPPPDGRPSARCRCPGRVRFCRGSPAASARVRSTRSRSRPPAPPPVRSRRRSRCRRHIARTTTRVSPARGRADAGGCCPAAATGTALRRVRPAWFLTAVPQAHRRVQAFADRAQEALAAHLAPGLVHQPVVVHLTRRRSSGRCPRRGFCPLECGPA